MSVIFLTEEQSLTYCTEVFKKLGITEEDARIVADHLTQAEFRGLSSHGIQRVIQYVTKLKHGGIKTAPHIHIIDQRLATARVDADSALGAVAAKYAMELCMEKARQAGTATVSVTHGIHCGFLAYYTMMAAKENMIGFAICNTGPMVVPWGAKEPLFGTNPLSIAIPAGEQLDIVYDGASSIVANGKVNVARIENRPIPEGWAVDREGNPTTDPHEAMAGYMLPFGTYKGSCLGIVIATMTAGLSRAPFEYEDIRERTKPDVGTDLAYTFGAIDISAFEDVDRFKERMDQYILYAKGLKKAPGFDEILMPGEKEFLCEKQMRAAGGFTIGKNLYTELKAIRDELGLCVDMESWLQA